MYFSGIRVKSPLYAVYLHRSDGYGRVRLCSGQFGGFRGLLTLFDSLFGKLDPLTKLRESYLATIGSD